jgi:SAM-dependent methyltransferase
MSDTSPILRKAAPDLHSAMSTCDFYDALSPYYHLIYPDWETSMARQSAALAAIIRSKGGPQLRSVLDAACGIGTQSLGLAKLGYSVTASDFSASAVARAQSEAINRGLSVQFAVADMRRVYEHHQREFDVVLACDNAIPHLLTDADILLAFEQFYRCVAPGGLCLVSVRDYASLDMSIPVQLHPYGVRQEADVRYILFQVWELHEPLYETTFYVVEHRAGAQPITLATRATYYAVPIPKLMRHMEQAGFSDLCRLDGDFFQPILAGRKTRKV